MGYVVVVFAIINTMALAAVGWYLRECWRDLPGYVAGAIQDEVRKQDDRIEKRLARAVDPAGNEKGPLPTREDVALQVGQPYRR